MVTNKLNLPQALVNFANSKDKHEYVENRYSVTELSNPTREIQLSRLHRSEITEDVADVVMALLGTAAHKILEENAHENAEQKFEVSLGEDTIVGVSDLITEDAIEDYKFTTVSKVQKKDFTDWRDQCLRYAWLNYLKTGCIKRKIRIHAFMRDWSKLKSNAISGYPASPLYTYEENISDSDYVYIEEKTLNKIKDIKENKNPQCTDEERWYTGDKYAVYKKAGDKRAVIVCDSEQEAHDYITNKCGGTGEIQVRKGESLKCRYYCKVSKWCYGGN